MKVSIFSRGIHPPSIGGQEIYTGIIKTFLEQNGFCVKVFTRNNRKNDMKKENIRGITYINRPIIRFFTLIIKYLWAFRRNEQKRSSDVIIANDVLAEGFASTLIKILWNVPLIVTMHGGGLYSFSRRFGFITRWIFSKADKIIVPNQYLRELALIYTKNPSKIVLIPHGVKKRDVGKEKKEILKRKLGIKNSKVLLIIARLVPLKSIDIAIKALKLLIDQGILPHLLIIGDGSERKKLEKLALRLNLADNISFLGKKKPEEVALFYEIADALILPSKMEGVGYVLLEAMVNSVPIIATNVGGIPELVFPGKNGYLVEVNNHTQIAQSIKKILNNPKLQKGIKEFNNKKIQQDHDINTNFSKLLPVLKSIS